MPLLGDYLGHLLSEITLARVQADLEAVRVAELYASHPHLKSMPVPRFRLPTITLDVPVSIQGMEQAKPGDSPRGAVSIPRLREHFVKLLDQHLLRSNRELSDAERAQLDKALDASLVNAGVPDYLSISPMLVADELVTVTATVLGESAPKKSTNDSALNGNFFNDLRNSARLELLNLWAAPPRLQVLVTTAELREAGPRELLAQLRLSISEEAFEWSMGDSQGKQISKLVPE